MFERQAATERAARLRALQAGAAHRFEAPRAGGHWLGWLSGLAGASPSPVPSPKHCVSAD